MCKFAPPNAKNLEAWDEQWMTLDNNIDYNDATSFDTSFDIVESRRPGNMINLDAYRNGKALPNS